MLQKLVLGNYTCTATPETPEAFDKQPFKACKYCCFDLSKTSAFFKLSCNVKHLCQKLCIVLTSDGAASYPPKCLSKVILYTGFHAHIIPYIYCYPSVLPPLIFTFNCLQIYLSFSFKENSFQYIFAMQTFLQYTKVYFLQLKNNGHAKD